MSVTCPTCQWPAFLEERGPAEDPSILLTGVARIGETAIQIVAIRIDPALRRTPDYRPDLVKGNYRADGLDTALETVLEEFDCIATEFEEMFGEDEASIVEFATGLYRVCAMPSYFASEWSEFDI